LKRKREREELGRRGAHEEFKREVYRGVPSYHRPTTKLKHVMPVTKGN
jgi:hypothetical protein